jgi:opacity protein-like surface antigen
MNAFRKWLFLSIFLVLVPGSKAQNPVFAGAAPSMEAGIGYSYLGVDIPSQNHIAMNGVDASFTADFRRRFGIRFDLGYDRAFNVFDTNRHADLLTYMAGPVFYPLRRRAFSAYTHLLLGGARETGVNFAAGGGVLTGWVNRFAWAAGGGVQYRLTPSFSVRLGADYMRTSFFNSNLAIEGQNNLRTSLSLVYTFGEHRE